MSDPQAASSPAGSSTAGDDPCNATITWWQDLNEELAVFRATPDAGKIEPFEPGQFATMGLPRNAPPISVGDDYPPDDPRWKKLWRRAYSIASSPKQDDHLEFYVVRVNDGKLTPKLWHMKDGGRLWIDPHIKGEFTLHGVPEGKDLVMVATGTGLAPYISMLKTYRGTNRWRRFVIIHGVRVSQDLGYVEELEQISAEDPTVKFIPSCTREPEGSPWKGMRGRVTQLFEPAAFEMAVGFPLTAGDCHVFLCGNPDMINQVEATLHGHAFVTQTRKQPGNIHLERYW